MAVNFKDFLDSDDHSNPHYMVIGHPISHSLSPLMHQCALDHHQIAAKYLAVDLSPDELTTFISWCNQEEFLGANITIPYKEILFDTVDEIDPVSSELGVINTICKENGKLTGYNTDLYGFMKPLEKYQEQLEGSSAIVFGSGGASKAVVSGLIQTGIHDITIVSRNPGKKKLFTTNPEVTMRLADYSNWIAFAEEASVIVNSTPVGMAPNTDHSPVNETESPLLKDKICYDLIYNPLKTRFLKLAEDHGGKPINGLEMLIWQGSRSFELWTGLTFPTDKIKAVLLDYFKR